MNPGHLIPQDQAAFLNLNHHPARLTVEQTAALLGHKPEHISLLVDGGFLEPLGDPPKNGVKVFALVDIQEKSKDVKWLDKANRYLTRHWQNKNAKAKQRQGSSATAPDRPCAVQSQALPADAAGG